MPLDGAPQPAAQAMRPRDALQLLRHGAPRRRAPLGLYIFLFGLFHLQNLDDLCHPLSRRFVHRLP